MAETVAMGSSFPPSKIFIKWDIIHVKYLNAYIKFFSQILANNLEVWEGMKVIADFVATGKLP